MREPLAALVLLASGIPNMPAQTAGPAPVLTLPQAEAIALRNHPRIAIAENQALSASQRVTEARSAYYPAINGQVTGSQGYDRSRIGAGALSSSVLFNRFGAGLQVNQLITDLGRTKNLVANSRLEAQAAEQSTAATRFDVILGVDRAYFGVLQARAFVRVAENTVQARSTVAEQVRALAAAQLKSQIDVSFAQVNVEQARLLLLRAQGEVREADADLSRALGEDRPATYQLEDQVTTEPLPPDAAPLIAEAVGNRPELKGLQLRMQAAERFEEAERDLRLPNVNLIGVGGGLPFLDQSPRVTPHEYEGVAVNLEIPIFNGHLFSARRRAAAYEATAAAQRLRDEQQQVQHDVQTAWLNASTAYQRIPVTEQLLKQAQLALELAQGRYNLGLASIVEITQAQLALTEAQIAHVSATYQYQDAFATLQYTVGNLR